jgi:hypothetical protein
MERKQFPDCGHRTCDPGRVGALRPKAAMIMPEKIKKPALEVQGQPSTPAEVAAHDMRASQALQKMKKAPAGSCPLGRPERPRGRGWWQAKSDPSMRVL